MNLRFLKNRDKTSAYQQEKGAGMTEYVLLVSLVGIALISAVNLLKQNVNSSFSNSTSALAN